MRLKIILFFIVIVFSSKAYCQPFVDIVNFNYFRFNSTYLDSLHSKNQTENYTLSLFYPKEFKNGNTLLIRTSGELVNSKSDYFGNENNNLYSASLGIGFQFLSNNKKWKYMLMGIPKTSFTHKVQRDGHNFHCSAVGLATYVHTDKLKFKAGLYYSKEFFGNFFVPLVSVEWKINNHWSTYGVIPSNYRIEYRFNNKLYSGLNLKAFTRSYLIDKNYGYVRNDELQIKLFMDYFIAKNILVYAEFGRTLGYNILQYNSQHQESYRAGDIYSPFKDNLFFSGGLAYRIRLDLE